MSYQSTIRQIRKRDSFFVSLKVVYLTHTKHESSIMNVVPVLISLGADGHRRTDVSLSNVFHEMTVTFFE